jgi:hypothetical protein
VRIVAVADTHLFHDDFVVPDGDVFVQAGDRCRAGNLVELRRAATWITRLPHRHKVIVAGNHDWAFALEPAVARAQFRGAHNLQDDRVELDGGQFYCAPWQPAFHDWAFNLPRGPELAEKWARIPRGVDVLITHGPPDGIGDRTGLLARAGCADLLARVIDAAPRLHLFGHIHQDGGAWQRGATLFANVTTWECERAPTVFDIDSDAVQPVSIPPHGRRDVD